MTIKLHGLAEYRFVAPGDVQEGDMVIEGEGEISKWLDELAASEHPELSAETKARHRACTRTPERTVLVRRPIV